MAFFLGHSLTVAICSEKREGAVLPKPAVGHALSGLGGRTVLSSQGLGSSTTGVTQAPLQDLLEASSLCASGSLLRDDGADMAGLQIKTRG